MFWSNPRRSPLKDPKGGLTQAGRDYFRRKEGAHLKPGVKGPANTPEKMRRKGSFLRRFYGRKTIPPLTTASGKPTRYALAAHAWGEKVPRNTADVRRLAAKGTALLNRYHATRHNPVPCVACLALLNNPAAHTCRRPNPWGPLFPLGQVVMTSTAQAYVSPDEARSALRRHSMGDWGEVYEEDREQNAHALRAGGQIMSVYRTDTGKQFWVITEWDRSVTTILLPEDY